jgi:hypothetical protein
MKRDIQSRLSKKEKQDKKRDDLNKKKAATKSPVIMNNISSNIPHNIEYEIRKKRSSHIVTFC